MAKFVTLPGFRDFFPEDCAARNYLFEIWRAAASRYGFVEYEGPVLEGTELYTAKSGAEITEQLFCFTDKGNREVAMRPELTPTLARMAAARQRDYRKPLKWFGIGRFFRYEKQQRGRLREFYQFNADILGEASPAADAELIALGIDVMRALGFGEADFAVRLSDRGAWAEFMKRENIADDNGPAFLQAIDKMERAPEEKTAAALAAAGTSLDAVRAFIENGGDGLGAIGEIRSALEARGMGAFVRVDLGIVRGLAYYTGPVFEFFALGEGMRAVAGGGRYDHLCGLLGGRGTDMPAAGFAMGDVVVSDLIATHGRAQAQLTNYVSNTFARDAYVIVAAEERRAEALGIVQALRADGLQVEFSLTPAKVGKQFQAAEQFQCRAAVIVGNEFPAIKVKDLLQRSEEEAPAERAAEAVRAVLARPEHGPLLA
ncbi:MAG: histidine--tRNA ligase [Verrucomicrobiales bacterium]